jgi:hypothetical protein
MGVSEFPESRPSKRGAEVDPELDGGVCKWDNVCSELEQIFPQTP